MFLVGSGASLLRLCCVYISRLQCTCFGGGSYLVGAVFVDSRVSLWRISRLQKYFTAVVFFLRGILYLVGRAVFGDSMYVCSISSFRRPFGCVCVCVRRNTVRCVREKGGWVDALNVDNTRPCGQFFSSHGPHETKQQRVSESYL